MSVWVKRSVKWSAHIVDFLPEPEADWSDGYAYIGFSRRSDRVSILYDLDSENVTEVELRRIV